MPNTLSYGYLDPITGDLSKGTSGWMASVNFDIERLATHSHNGIDSALLSSAVVSGSTVSAPSGSWVANAGGSGLPASGYKQTVTVPAAISDINNFSVTFRISTAGATQYQQVFLFYKRLTATTFALYSNDNTISVTCLFR